MNIVERDTKPVPNWTLFFFICEKVYKKKHSEKQNLININNSISKNWYQQAQTKMPLGTIWWIYNQSEQQKSEMQRCDKVWHTGLGPECMTREKNKLNKAKTFTGIRFSTQAIIQQREQRQRDQAEAQGQEQNLVKTFVAGDKDELAPKAGSTQRGRDNDTQV